MWTSVFVLCNRVMRIEWREKMSWLIGEESGQGVVEYALILVLVAMVSLVAIGTFGTSLAQKYEAIVNSLS